MCMQHLLSTCLSCAPNHAGSNSNAQKAVTVKAPMSAEEVEPAGGSTIEATEAVGGATESLCSHRTAAGAACMVTVHNVACNDTLCNLHTTHLLLHFVYLVLLSYSWQ